MEVSVMVRRFCEGVDGGRERKVGGGKEGRDGGFGAMGLRVEESKVMVYRLSICLTVQRLTESQNQLG
jgi:hypothetical protein